MNWTLILIRGCLPAVQVVLIGTALTVVTNLLRQAMPVPLESWHVMSVSATISVCALAMLYRRLLRWESGAALPCERCGGPLGGLLMGKQYRGRQLGDYRRCYNCGKANASAE